MYVEQNANKTGSVLAAIFGLHHLNDSPVVSTSTTAHSMSPKDVASLTARVVTCLEGIIVACCCCGADEVAVRCQSRMYVLKELKLVLCELFA